MGATIKNARAKRLAEAGTRERARKVSSVKLATSPAGHTIAGKASLLTDATDWSDPAERAGHADVALTLYAKEKSLITAFRKFQLDPQNPYHWKLLTRYMAESLFGERGRPRGTGHQAADGGLVQQMQSLIERGKAKTPTEAARMAMGKSTPGKSKAASIDRLVRRHRAAYGE